MQVLHTTKSGLFVAENRATEGQIAAALKDIDSALILTWEFEDGRQVWKVHAYAGSDRPAQYLCSWRDERTSEPLPLSHGLVEQVKRMRLDSRADRIDADAHNAKLRSDETKRFESEMDEVAEDFDRADRNFGHFSGPLQRSPGLVAARRRAREKGMQA